MSTMREWHIVFDLAGRDEDALVDRVEELLCGPDHLVGQGDCLVPWFSCAPASTEATS